MKLLWIKILISSFMSGVVMSMFIGFRGTVKAQVAQEHSLPGYKLLGHKIRAIRGKSFAHVAGWGEVLIRLFGMIVGIFLPPYVFFYSPWAYSKLSGTGLACYLMLAMLFVKASDAI